MPLERLPFFKLFVADYLLDTRSLSQEEHGAYILLMLNYYWDGLLPEERSKLYELTRADTQSRKSAADHVIDKFFHVDGERLVHNRIERELEKLGGLRRRQSDAGKASAAARAKKPRKPSASKANGLDGFEAFYMLYPKKVAREDAESAWKKLHPDAELQSKMTSALQIQRTSATWQKDDGQFIPNPATWINGKRWQDDARAADNIRRNPDGSRKASL